MPKWISVEEAAAKYGINKEVIWLWADMKRFPMSYEKGITTVDEESLIGFLHQNKDRATAEYIDTLEDLCIGKTKICILYAEIIGYQDKELLNQREQIARMKEIQIVMKRQNNRIRDCEKFFAKYEKWCSLNHTTIPLSILLIRYNNKLAVRHNLLHIRCPHVWLSQLPPIPVHLLRSCLLRNKC